MTFESRIKNYEEVLKKQNQKKKNVMDSLSKIDEQIKCTEDTILNLKIKKCTIEYDNLMNPK